MLRVIDHIIPTYIHCYPALCSSLPKPLHCGSCGCRISPSDRVTYRLYHDPARESGFASFKKLLHASRQQCNIKQRKKLAEIKEFLERQVAYNLHRPLRRRIARNPYSVNNILDVWECYLLDVQSLSKFNDVYKYVLTVIHNFSKFLHMIPIKSKTGTAVSL
jgi:hypothetical protein